jgi:WhiB family redox-sensing transcriptional regulator
MKVVIVDRHTASVLRATGMDPAALIEGGWKDTAACAEEDPRLFFPPGDGEASRRQAARAKLVCSSCPVSEQCAAYALLTNQLYGIWGGLDEEERLDLRRLRHRHSRHATAGAPQDAGRR